jgi:hypothetical protein
MINTNQSGVFDDNALDVLDELCWAFHHKHLDPNDFPKLDKLAHKLEEKRQALKPC